MLITIHRGTTSIRTILPASVQWAAPASGRFGTASFVIPRSSRLWTSGVLTEDGGQLVLLSDGRHSFAGVANAPVWDAAGARITVLDIGEWVGIRPLLRRRTFRACPASVIARAAIRDAFEGSGVLPVTLGPCAIGGPIIPRYAFDGRQTAGQVLTALTEQTGQEWVIDHASYQFRWQAQIGRYHEGLLTDVGDLFPTVPGRDLMERYQRVTEVDGRTRRQFTAVNGTVPLLWPSATVVEV
jgi:hypothetical protein